MNIMCCLFKFEQYGLYLQVLLEDEQRVLSMIVRGI